MDNSTQAADFLTTILENLPYGIVLINLNGEVSICNDLAVKLLNIGTLAINLKHKNLLDHIQDIPELPEVLVSCLQKDCKPFDLISLYYNSRYLNIKVRCLPDGILISTEDVSYIKEIELTNLKSVLNEQELERQRLAKEIHDGIGPLISTIKLHLDGVKSDLTEATPKAAKKIAAMEELVQNISTDIRGISHALMPSALIDFGLVTALQNLCMIANESGKINIQFYHSGMKNRLPKNMALNLFRITQELLNNAFKYAHAKIIHVQLIRHTDTVILSVEDDGVGFALEKLKEVVDKGIGLKNIQTRVSALEGTLNIETQPGKGVMVTIELPI